MELAYDASTFCCFPKLIRQNHPISFHTGFFHQAIPGAIIRVIAILPLRISVHLQHILHPVRIILHCGNRFNQPRAAVPDEPGWLYVGLCIAQSPQHLGRTGHPVRVGRGQKNPQLIILLGNRLTAAVTPLGKHIGTSYKGVEVFHLPAQLLGNPHNLGRMLLRQPAAGHVLGHGVDNPLQFGVPVNGSTPHNNRQVANKKSTSEKSEVL